MYDVSENFLGSVRQSGRRKTVADLYYGTSLFPIASDIPVSGGSISIDREGDIRRSGNLQIADDQLNLNLFLPTGIEVVIRSGFNFYTGTEELVPLGIFRVEDLSFNEGEQNSVTVSFFDRGRAMQDVVNLVDKNVAGLTFQTVLTEIVDHVFINTGTVPQIISEYDLEQQFPGGTVLNGTYLDTVKKIAEALAGEQYFDVNGNLNIGTIPSITTATSPTEAVWNVDVGATGVLVKAGRKTTRSGTYNGVGVFGATVDDNAGDDRVFGKAYDMNPLSPTFYDGFFGRRTLRINNDLLTSNDACVLAAEAQLKNLQGLAKRITFTSLWNPALDVGDIVLFTFLDGSTEIHMVDSLNFDLASGEMTGETRTTQYIGD